MNVLPIDNKAIRQDVLAHVAMSEEQLPPADPVVMSLLQGEALAHYVEHHDVSNVWEYLTNVWGYRAVPGETVNEYTSRLSHTAAGLYEEWRNPSTTTGWWRRFWVSTQSYGALVNFLIWGRLPGES